MTSQAQNGAGWKSVVMARNSQKSPRKASDGSAADANGLRHGARHAGAVRNSGFTGVEPWSKFQPVSTSVGIAMEHGMYLLQLIAAGLILLSAGFLQGTVAFGFALLSVPLLLMVGLPVPVVLTITAVCAAVQALSGVQQLHHTVPWKEVGMSVAVRSVTMLLGVWVLRRLAHSPVSQITFWIGFVLLLLVVLLAVWRPQPRARLHSAWSAAAFCASGFAGGLCSMDGPPLVLWVMAHDWSAERTRAFLFAAFMSVVPLQLSLLYWAFGSDVLHGMIWGAVLSPAALVGSLLGLRIGARFSKPLLRRLAFVLLTAVALSAMLPQLRAFL